jgi:hypothetical protein
MVLHIPKRRDRRSGAILKGSVRRHQRHQILYPTARHKTATRTSILNLTKLNMVLFCYHIRSPNMK